MLCTVIRDDLMDVLYDEAEPGTAKRVDEHLAACPTCREEMLALRHLRRDLGEWKLPASLGPTPRTSPAVLSRRAAYFGAIAAGLLLALGGAFGLSGAELRYQKGTFAFRLGRADATGVEQRIAAQEARHREEMRALAASLETAVPRDDAALLSRVGEMIRESEARQAARVQARLADVSEKSDAQRRYDLARMSAGLSYLDGKNGEQVARTTELMGYVLQASQKR